MPRVWVSVGSNIDPESHIRGALADLRQTFGELTVSPLYETEAVGFAGDAFLNLVVGFETDERPALLHERLRDIEARHGRRRDGPKFSSRTLDLDLLTYGEAVTDEGGKALPRDEILRYAFVLGPLADVAGEERHPQLGASYAGLWARFPAAEKARMRRLPDPDWLHAGDR